MFSQPPPRFRCTICRQTYHSEDAAKRCQLSGDPGVRITDVVVPKDDPAREGEVVGFADGHRKVRVQFRVGTDGQEERLFQAHEIVKALRKSVRSVLTTAKSGPGR